MAQSRHARSPEEMLSGEGALKYGGRWNSVGVAAVYCGESLSLCALEILVHLPRGVLQTYRYLEVTVPDGHVETLEHDGKDDITVTQQIGDRYLGAEGPLAFRVRSSANPLEHNLILNPDSSRFDEVAYGEVQAFPMDPRLLDR